MEPTDRNLLRLAEQIEDLPAIAGDKTWKWEGSTIPLENSNTKKVEQIGVRFQSAAAKPFIVELSTYLQVQEEPWESLRNKIRDDPGSYLKKCTWWDVWASGLREGIGLAVVDINEPDVLISQLIGWRRVGW